MRRAGRTAVVVLLAGALSARGAELPRGTIIDKVTCKDDPAHSYALYLPSAYANERPWPILYLLDARGRALLALGLFREAAEARGYIVVSSYESASDRIDDPNVAAVRAMWHDAHARFSLDDRRAYAAGFSGTVRVLCAMAQLAPGSFAGIFGASGGFPSGRPPTKDVPFAFFGTTGLRDFNYLENLDLDERLGELNLPHRVEVFDGEHEWPPAALAERGLAWLDLRAMRMGTLAADEVFIDAFVAGESSRARRLEAAGELHEAWRAWRALAKDLAGLRDVASLLGNAAAIETSRAFRRDSRQRAARADDERRFTDDAGRVLTRIVLETPPPTAGDVRAELGLRRLLRQSQRARNPEERFSAERRLSLLFVQAAFYAPRQLQEGKQDDRLLSLLSIAEEIEPRAPEVEYRLAAAYARRGSKTPALDHLERAIEAGWRDRARLDAEDSFRAFRGDGRFVGMCERLSRP